MLFRVFCCAILTVSGGDTKLIRPLQKAIYCIMKVEAILDRKFLKPPFKETIKPPGPGKLAKILLNYVCTT